MAEGWPGAGRAALLVLVAALGACGRLAGAGGEAPAEAALALSFEDAPSPGVFLLEAPALRDAPDGSAGLWAAVRGLARPERAEAVNLATGARVDLALYRAGAADPAIRLSNAAADALGVEESAMNVRITALRRRPVVDTK
jgi:hypothetical protein